MTRTQKQKQRQKQTQRQKKTQRQKQTQRRFKKLKCSPNQNSKVLNNMRGISCYSKQHLLVMKNLWNKHNNEKISSNNAKIIWLFFKNKLSNKCLNESCWLNEKGFLNINKDYVIKDIFRPFSPKSWKTKPYEWLSSVDIKNVMTQYEKTYKNFVFIGPSPIDFDSKKIFSICVWEKLCKFNLSNYINNKKTKIGIIFNTDPHYKTGSHWIALFIDINKKFIFYFDSNGDKIPKEIKIFINRVKQQGSALNINFKILSNVGKEHQLKDGQCGMYTLYFIIELLRETKTPYYFKNNRIKDEQMRDYRIKYYNYE